MLTREPITTYQAEPERYQNMLFQACGKSGLKLPCISLGLWHNFGDNDCLVTARSILHKAFDSGVTHFDLANNYGPPYGSAEQNFGCIFQKDFKPFRDEMLISSKAGYDMWAGPYGIGGSRKHMIASCEQSLKRTGLDYFDIFYHHCPDDNTPIEETLYALEQIVRSGKALYVGLSNYQGALCQNFITEVQKLKLPLVIHQTKYNMLARQAEENVFPLLKQADLGCIVYSPLAQGLLTEKYLSGIPQNSRASNHNALYLSKDYITPSLLAKVKALAELASARNQSLAQMALAWTLNHSQVTSCLVGASSPEQLEDSLNALTNTHFSQAELEAINQVLN